MKGVESIIGAYLALVIIVGVLTTLYLYVDYARQGISSQFTEYIDRQLLLVYPPILSLSYVNDTWFKLSVTPYIPVNLDEIVVRNLDGELIYSISVKEVVSNTREYLLSINETPLIIQLLTSSGEIIYYLPRNDPKLLNAPENIKLKPYIDQELLEYLKTSSRTTIRDDPYSETSFITLLNQLGYKVFVAKTTTLNDSSIVENLLLNGPLLCPYKNNVANPYNTLCNIQLWPSHYTYPGFISITSFLTYRYNTSYWWFDDYDYFYLKTNLSSYIPTVNLSYNQILRVIKAKPGLYQLNYSIDGYIHVRNHLTTYATGLVVVVYILPGNIDLQNQYFSLHQK